MPPQGEVERVQGLSQLFESDGRGVGDGPGAAPGGRLVCLPLAWRDPAAAFAPLAGLPHAVFLDSARAGDPRSRYSVIAAEPVRLALLAGGVVTLDGRPAELGFGSLPGALLAGRSAPRGAIAGPLPGLLGFVGYEAGSLLERLPAPLAPDLGFADLQLGLYDAVAVFDGTAQRAWVTAWGADEAAATRAAQSLAGRLGRTLPPADERPGDWDADAVAEVFPALVRRCRDYIAAGDIYQANLTWRFLGRLPPGLPPFDLYRRLRALSPAPFAAFLGCGPGRAILSASPERFLLAHPDGRVETRPIKGTRPRAADAATDAALAAELLASAKDRAENLMIVDLLRNDLSRVSRVGSVRVPQLCALESFPSVHHLVSVVESRLLPGAGAAELLAAAFPGGSITGAPKIRAMEIIRELEPARRGPYCGSILHLGLDGALDSSILIRTLMVADDRVAAHAGGGIVWDSDPEAELEELRTKAAPLLAALAGRP